MTSALFKKRLELSQNLKNFSLQNLLYKERLLILNFFDTYFLL